MRRARRPPGHRFSPSPFIILHLLLPSRVPITFLFGGRSFISPDPGYETQERRKDMAPVRVHMLPNAGHQVMWGTLVFQIGPSGAQNTGEKIQRQPQDTHLHHFSPICRGAASL